MALLSHELPSGMQGSAQVERAFPRIRILPSTGPVEAVPIAFAPTNEADPDLSQARSVLYKRPEHTVWDVQTASITTDRDLSYDNPILDVGFIHSPDTRRTLDDFLKISVAQRNLDREKNQRRVLPRTEVVFRGSQATLRRA